VPLPIDPHRPPGPPSGRRPRRRSALRFHIHDRVHRPASPATARMVSAEGGIPKGSA
jgi:hypothetical protein